MDGGSCAMSGGGVSVRADLHDMRRTAAILDGSGDEATDLCTDVASSAGNLPMKSALMSPGSAADVAGRVFALTVGPSSLGALALRMEVVAQGLRIGADAYATADAVNQLALQAISVAAAPIVMAGVASTAAVMATADVFSKDPMIFHEPDFLASWGSAFVADLGEIETDQPYVLDEAMLMVRSLFWLADPAHPSFQQQAATLVSLGRTMGFFVDDEPLEVHEADTAPTVPVRAPRDLGDWIRQEQHIESGGLSNTDHTTVRVHHVVHDDGTAAWVVNIPGTQNWQLDGPHNPADGSTNFITMAAGASTMYPAVRTALRRAMHRAGVEPGTEPVMLVGHSQGGIVATRMVQDPHFRQTFDVTSVLTVASPVTRMTVPDGVNTLEIEHTGDIVPGLDADHTPEQADTAQLSCTPVHPSDDPLDLHHASAYVDTAEQHLGRSTDNPMAQHFYDESAVFFDGSDTIYDYSVKRP